jgi:hypothetical protein
MFMLFFKVDSSGLGLGRWSNIPHTSTLPELLKMLGRV